MLSTKENDGWFWYVPLDNDVTSVGVVGDIDRLIGNRKGTPEEILNEEIVNCPGLEGRMNNAQRCGAVHVLSDFSYRATRCAGEGWVLVGDAFGFLDPMYSSGVYLALGAAPHDDGYQAGFDDAPICAHESAFIERLASQLAPDSANLARAALACSSDS